MHLATIGHEEHTGLKLDHAIGLRARLQVASHLSTTPRGRIQPSAFPNGTTGKLASLCPHCPFNAERQAGKL